MQASSFLQDTAATASAAAALAAQFRQAARADNEAPPSLKLLALPFPVLAECQSTLRHALTHPQAGGGLLDHDTESPIWIRPPGEHLQAIISTMKVLGPASLAAVLRNLHLADLLHCQSSFRALAVALLLSDASEDSLDKRSRHAPLAMHLAGRLAPPTVALAHSPWLLSRTAAPRLLPFLPPDGIRRLHSLPEDLAHDPCGLVPAILRGLSELQSCPRLSKPGLHTVRMLDENTVGYYNSPFRLLLDPAGDGSAGPDTCVPLSRVRRRQVELLQALPPATMKHLALEAISTPEWANYIGGLRALTHLELRFRADAGMRLHCSQELGDCISQLQSLRHLVLAGTTCADLPYAIQRLPLGTLSALVLSWSQASSAAVLAALAEALAHSCASLQQLALSAGDDTPDSASLARLLDPLRATSQLTTVCRLRSLRTWGLSLGPAEIGWVATLSQLTSLSLCVHCAWLPSLLRELPQLVSLRLQDMNAVLPQRSLPSAAPAGLPLLDPAFAPQLRNLRLVSTHPFPGRIAAFAQQLEALPMLTSLQYCATNLQGHTDPCTLQIMPALHALSRLQCLHVIGPCSASTGLAVGGVNMAVALRKMPYLTHLEIRMQAGLIATDLVRAIGDSHGLRRLGLSCEWQCDACSSDSESEAGACEQSPHQGAAPPEPLHGSTASSGVPNGQDEQCHTAVHMHELPRYMQALTQLTSLCLEGPIVRSQSVLPVALRPLEDERNALHPQGGLSGLSSSSVSGIPTVQQPPCLAPGLAALVQLKELTLQFHFQFVDALGPELANMAVLERLFLHVCCEELGAPDTLQRRGILERLWPWTESLPMSRGVRVTSQPISQAYY
jgi:hypothetical protein